MQELFRRFSLLIIFLVSMSITSAQTTQLGFIDVFADVETNTIYVGQPVVFTARIFVNSEIENIDFLPPPFSGFGQSDLPPTAETTREFVSGIDFTRTTIQYILYPLRAGTLTIEPYQVRVRETPFAPSTTLTSNPITIEVVPLTDGAPEGFKNAVGQFDVQASINTGVLQFGEPLSLSLTVSGLGNIEQILAPDLPFSATWRVVEQESQFEQQTLRFGRKIFNWSVFPDRGGLINIPSISLIYFNPENGLYETRPTIPLGFEVVGAPEVTRTPIPTLTKRPTFTPVGDGRTLEAIIAELTPTGFVTATRVSEATRLPPTATNTPSATATSVVVENDNGVDIVRNELQASGTALKAIPENPINPTPPLWFWVLWLVPTFVIGLTTIMNLASESAGETTRVSRGSSPMKVSYDQLKEARDNQSAKDAYRTVLDAITSYLSARSKTPVTTDNFDEVVQTMPANIRTMIIACYEEALTGVYAPVTDNDSAVLISRTRQALREADRSWRP